MMHVVKNEIVKKDNKYYTVKDGGARGTKLLCYLEPSGVSGKFYQAFLTEDAIPLPGSIRFSQQDIYL